MSAHCVLLRIYVNVRTRVRVCVSVYVCVDCHIGKEFGNPESNDERS